RRQTEPGAVAPDDGSPCARCRKHHVRETQLVRGVSALAGCNEASARAPRVADLRDRDGLADHMGVGREDDFGARGRFEVHEGASVVGLNGPRHGFFPLPGVSVVGPSLSRVVSATTRSKSLSKSRSCTMRYFSNSVSACAWAISAVTLLASESTAWSVASRNRFSRVSQSCMVMGILRSAMLSATSRYA